MSRFPNGHPMDWRRTTCGCVDGTGGLWFAVPTVEMHRPCSRCRQMPFDAGATQFQPENRHE